MNEKKSSILDSLEVYDPSDVLKNVLNDIAENDEKPVEKPEKIEVVENEEISPLEKMKKNKEEGKLVSGVIVSNEDLEKGKEVDNKTIPLYSDERLQDWKKAEDDLDTNIEKTKYVTVIKPPTDKFEYMLMMDELNSVVIHDDGTATIEYKNAEGDKMEPQFLAIKKNLTTNKSGDSDFYLDKNIIENTTETTTVEESPKEKEEVDEDVTVLIDKTGFGVDFAFTEEERNKIVESKLIKIKEVSTENLNTLITNKSEMTFGDLIQPVDTSGVYTTIYFPASGFKAKMKGLTYGEWTELALSIDPMNFDNYRKRLTIIYNKMTDVSCKPFEDFEDFLNQFSYSDIPLALYGILVSTEMEESEVQLQCNNPECDQTFDWKFKTRSILRIEKCSKLFRGLMTKVIDAQPYEYETVHRESPVMTSKYIELPESKFIVELGIASAYHFLYNFTILANEELFKEVFGTEINKELYAINALLLVGVRKIFVPDGYGKYIECSTYKDLLNAIYDLKPREISILRTCVREYENSYDPVFSIGDVECPHCHHKSEDLGVEIDNLVFWTYQQLTNTEFDLSSILPT